MNLDDTQRKHVVPAAKAAFKDLSPEDRAIISRMADKMVKQGYRGMGRDTALEVLACIGMYAVELEKKGR